MVLSLRSLVGIARFAFKRRIMPIMLRFSSLYNTQEINSASRISSSFQAAPGSQARSASPAFAKV